MGATHITAQDEREGCQWLVRRPSNNPEPDSIDDCYVTVPCGDEVHDATRGPFCRDHLVPIEMPLDEFERAVDEGRSWS